MVDREDAVAERFEPVRPVAPRRGAVVAVSLGHGTLSWSVVGEAGLEPAVSCSQSTCVANYATPRSERRIPDGRPVAIRLRPRLTVAEASTRHLSRAPGDERTQSGPRARNR